MNEQIFNECRGIMGTENPGQDDALRRALLHFAHRSSLPSDDLRAVLHKIYSASRLRDVRSFTLSAYAILDAADNAAPPQSKHKPREVKRHSDFSVLVVFNSCREASVFESSLRSPQAEAQVPQGWKGYVTVIDGQFLKSSRPIPDGTYALIDRGAKAEAQSKDTP